MLKLVKLQFTMINKIRKFKILNNSQLKSLRIHMVISITNKNKLLIKCKEKQQSYKLKFFVINMETLSKQQQMSQKK
jgi:hypothetical protein